MSLRTVSRTTTTGLTGFVALVLVGGCVIGTDETDGEPIATSPYAGIAGFCEKVAGAQCSDAIVEGCHASSAESLEEDRKRCVAARKSISVCNPNGLGYSSEGAEECVAAHKAAYEDGTITEADLEAIDEACLVVLNGGGKQGGTCRRDDDCDTPNDLRCVRKNGGETGICVVPVEVGAGLDCSAGDAECIEGFYCNSNNDCVGLEGVGQECGTGMPCEDDLLCNAQADAPGVCYAKSGNGQACSADAECTSGFCTIGTSAEEGNCTATRRFESTSQACETFK